jgi:glycosyltransferase involved in cell wall biosynthesis
VWLGYVTESFLSAGFRVTLAIDMRPEGWRIMRDFLPENEPNLTIRSVFDQSGRLKSGRLRGAVACCLSESGADQVFCNCFDTISSSLLRRAAFGLLPPEILRGRLGGIYLRPRHLDPSQGGLNNFIKGAGFRRLNRGGWFTRLFIYDEFLFQEASATTPCLGLLPDPWSGDFTHPMAHCRRALGLPAGARIFLHYGTASPRKGLHLAVRAMLQMPAEIPAFLLCAGHEPKDREIVAGLKRLTAPGRALVLGHYASQAEEELCFCAADAVLLPYVGHYGSSGVLSRAAAAGKVLIASEEGLLGRRVKEHALGLLFEPGSATELQEAMLALAKLDEASLASYRLAGLHYAATCSCEAFIARLAKSIPRVSHDYGAGHVVFKPLPSV